MRRRWRGESLACARCGALVPALTSAAPHPPPAPPTDRMVLKTCGTTKLLSCVPYMCQLAAGVGLEPARVKYTRASFLFPEQQPAPHTSFEQVGTARGYRRIGQGTASGASPGRLADHPSARACTSRGVGKPSRHPTNTCLATLASPPPPPPPVSRSVTASSLPLPAWAPPRPTCLATGSTACSGTSLWRVRGGAPWGGGRAAAGPTGGAAGAERQARLAWGPGRLRKVNQRCCCRALPRPLSARSAGAALQPNMLRGSC